MNKHPHPCTAHWDVVRDTDVTVDELVGCPPYVDQEQLRTWLAAQLTEFKNNVRTFSLKELAPHLHYVGLPTTIKRPELLKAITRVPEGWLWVVWTGNTRRAVRRLPDGRLQMLRWSRFKRLVNGDDDTDTPQPGVMWKAGTPVSKSTLHVETETVVSGSWKETAIKNAMKLLRDPDRFATHDHRDHWVCLGVPRQSGKADLLDQIVQRPPQYSFQNQANGGVVVVHQEEAGGEPRVLSWDEFTAEMRELRRVEAVVAAPPAAPAAPEVATVRWKPYSDAVTITPDTGPNDTLLLHEARELVNGTRVVVSTLMKKRLGLPRDTTLAEFFNAITEMPPTWTRFEYNVNRRTMQRFLVVRHASGWTAVLKTFRAIVCPEYVLQQVDQIPLQDVLTHLKPRLRDAQAALKRQRDEHSEQLSEVEHKRQRVQDVLRSSGSDSDSEATVIESDNEEDPDVRLLPPPPATAWWTRFTAPTGRGTAPVPLPDLSCVSAAPQQPPDRC